MKTAAANEDRIPSKFDVRIARLSAQLTQGAAAKIVHLGAQTRWAEYENGTHKIDRARWDLFLLLTDQHPDYRVLRRRKPV